MAMLSQTSLKACGRGNEDLKLAVLACQDCAPMATVFFNYSSYCYS